jgi:ATP-dependent Lon protease
MKVYGIKLYIYNSLQKKGILIFGIVDDVIIDLLNSKFIQNKILDITKNKPNELHYNDNSFDKFMNSLILKDYLINTNYSEFYNKYAGYISQYNLLRQNSISQTVELFLSEDIFSKRNMLIYLLIKSDNCENLYLAYLLYDILSNDTNGHIDTLEQTSLFNSFPWYIKQIFKSAMKKTIEYTNELSNFDINNIPLEQQICLLKVSDTVKEKAMVKLKEVKSKTEDSGFKARQYLDGLIKIPFMIYRREPILNLMNDIRVKFKEIYNKYDLNTLYPKMSIPNKEKYTSIEIINYINKLNNNNLSKNNNINLSNNLLDKIQNYLLISNKTQIINNIVLINNLLVKNSLKIYKIKYNKLTKDQLKSAIINLYKIINDYDLLNKITSCFVNDNLDNELNNNLDSDFNNSLNIELKNEIQILNNEFGKIKDYMNYVKVTLDKAVYGHNKAKKQIEKIICQWVNGELDGYCFGFEGAPGIGKTSLAKKGLADCLKDNKDVSRPFALIAMGGDSNGSTLHGHNYTYVGSTWGSIVQILMDKKCMNPIIFIDEVDKISRTEQGREIIGILTHLLDPTQNETFQDKYFSGIDLDLSKALFILSYNDVEAIDKILLDRIHRIKFNNLTLEDKIVICNAYILPEIYKKMGLEDVIYFSDETIKFIIDEYTLEAGVRKLKEKMFEIVGEINLNVLKGELNIDDLPIHITINDIRENYFKDKREITVRKVPNIHLIGYVNGMYATALGTGGTLPIHAKFFPSDKFLELKLTGLQQEVMRESMNVSLTVAWDLTPSHIKAELRKLYDTEGNRSGINIHTGDNSVSKDGPSGGCAITIAIYSLLNNIPVKPEFAITGEIQMSGEVTEIGGLNNKILGSIKSSVKTFIYPKENKKDFDEFYEKYKTDERLTNIHFYAISHINEALELILVD